MVAVLVPIGAGLLVAAGIGSAEGDKVASPGAKPAKNPIVEIKHDTSAPLRSLPPKSKKKAKQRTEHRLPVPAPSATADPVVQSSAPRVAAPSPSASFDGVGVDGSAPPDTNGAAGLNRYVQIVNQNFQVFTKAGLSVYGPAATNTIWSGFTGDCEDNNDGDATVSYDRLADRWVIQQFSISGSDYFECIAVSKTSDPTGQWHRYQFGGFGDDFPDYPKLSVWPDAYYVTYNLFAGGSFFAGPEVCAYNRAKMLIGQTATPQCFEVTDTSVGGLLPADLDSPTALPPGSPNYVLAFDTNSLVLWKFHVDWANKDNSTFSSGTHIPVASFTPACTDGGACVAQKGTSQKLDSIGDRLMYRLAYRNFGDHESLVVTHAVKVGTSAGVRWYELRNPNGTPVVHQQGTYAPDAKFRWMSSAAMDANGGIALGYSVSSSTTNPDIGYTGRLAGDPLGTMTQGDALLGVGLGSQLGTFGRWGDYSSMSIDPFDDCTFWFTSEYLTTTGDFNWRTRIVSFKLPGCAGAVADDFSIGATPNAVTVEQGDSGDTSINTTVTTGAAQTVSLSAGGQPYDTTVSFAPSSISSGGSSTMTIDVGQQTPAGTYTITVLGTGTTSSQTTIVTLTVSLADAVTNGSFANGLSGWAANGLVPPATVMSKKLVHSPGAAAQLGSATPFAGDSTLSQTVDVPSGKSQLAFWYQPHCKGGKSSTDRIQAQLRTTGGALIASLLNVCANSNNWSRATFDTTAYAGQTIVLRFNAHDDGLRGKSTYFLLDDVALTAPSGGNVIENGGLEAGTLTGWTTTGVSAPLVTSVHHSGAFAAQLGSSTAFNGDSVMKQVVIVPGGNPVLTIWYQPHCADLIQFDGVKVEVQRASGPAVELLRFCSTASRWLTATFDMTPYAGQQITLVLTAYDDGFPEDPAYAYFDDITLG